ncbi:MAG: aspartate aminotransferase family protein [Xanthomonadales bacterium]|nr:aspartate aminotransferase family protein [Xanthomonadales bacterium]
MPKYLMNTYARLPVAFTHGKGAWLWDTEGRKYLDVVSGLGVTSLGHAHPEVTAVIVDQAGVLLHTANLAEIPWQNKLAEKLCKVSLMDKAFIANTGAEAVECALKIARLIGHQQGYKQPLVAVTSGAFHGRTLATISATDNAKIQRGFEPLVSGFIHLPYADSSAFEKAISDNPQLVAILLEPIQGETGVVVPPAGYFKKLRELCDQHNILLICDEIQAGLNRTGKWFAHQHEEILPDIITVAKALANGIPIGACLARGKAATAFSPGNHGSTFGGNPLACRTACSVLDIMERDQLGNNAKTMGDWLQQQFKQLLANDAKVLDIRGRGLMLAIELDRSAIPVRDAALAEGVLINVTHETIIRLLPPLILNQTEAEKLVETVTRLILKLS